MLRRHESLEPLQLVPHGLGHGAAVLADQHECGADDHLVTVAAGRPGPQVAADLTSATSRTLTGTPRREAITAWPISSKVRIRASARTKVADRPLRFGPH